MCLIYDSIQTTGYELYVALLLKCWMGDFYSLSRSCRGFALNVEYHHYDGNIRYIGSTGLQEDEYE